MTNQPHIYCEDCVFFQKSPSGASYAKCGAELARSNGADRYVARELDVPPYCSTMRASSKDCGPDAKWFVAKSEGGAS